MTSEANKYKPLEPVLNKINAQYISLSEEEKTKNNKILRELLDTIIIPQLKKTNELFKNMYQRVFYGGSFYDELRVGTPDEFDLDLLLALPKLLYPEIVPSNKPGHVMLKINKYNEFLLQKDLAARYKGIENFFADNNNYLDVKKVLQWMESIVTKALNPYKRGGMEIVLKLQNENFIAKTSKSGPAITLKLSKIGKNDCVMDIDLVPCFVFRGDKWPEAYRPNPVPSKPEFFIVPKPLKDDKFSHYWRLSFQEQERELMKGNKKFKPTVKLLKKMRDTAHHDKVASYFIKTVLLWELEKKNDADFWDKSSLSLVFMTMLKQYQSYIAEGKINYYWYKSNKSKSKNLLEGVSGDTINNMSNYLKRAIDDIKRNLNEPTTIAKYILNKEELKSFS